MKEPSELQKNLDPNCFRRAIIADAFNDIMQKTCFKIIGRTSERDYVYIMKGNGCNRYYLQRLLRAAHQKQYGKLDCLAMSAEAAVDSHYLLMIAVSNARLSSTK